MTAPARPPADRERGMTSAERQRRYRARARDGRRVVPVEVDASIIEDALVRRRFLRREDADDPEKVAAALQAAIAQLITPPAEPYDTVTRNAIDFRTVR